jgi:hypothetical protein
MSDEFCAGVQILLKRMESNPDEFINPNEYRWQKVVAGVFARKEGISNEGVGAVRGLTDAEVDALHAGFTKLARPAFDEYVMKNIFDEPNENETISYQMAQGKRAQHATGWNDPRMAQGRGTYQVTVGGGGSGGSGQVQPESVMSKLKRELGL